MEQPIEPTLTPLQVAERIGVSVATIRNWIKSGELRCVEANSNLDSNRKAGVTLQSIELFERLHIGSKRLVSRANKQHKHTREGTKKSNDSQYDRSLSESRRNIDGVYYTPENVVRDMLQTLTTGDDLSDKLFLDPCCGSGNFLIEALAMGFRIENIYGYEIDPRSAKIARQRIFQLTGYRTRNIICGDFLQIATTSKCRYDYCATNPPWGRKMSPKVRLEQAKRLSMGRSADSSSLFLVASLSMLRDSGRLSFLLPESFFTVRTHSEIRRYIFDYKIDSLTDYGRVFPTLLTCAAAVSLTKTVAAQGSLILCRTSGESYFRSRESFLCNPMLVLNLWTTPAEAELIEGLFSREHITLRGGARWGIGVVTGNNREHLRSEGGEGWREVVRGADILPESKESFGRGRVRRGVQYIKDDLSKYQQVAPAELYDTKEKLIYKFVSQRLAFALDREGLLTLNSANILVPNSDFPLSCEELAMVLNSDFMSWLFRALFHTRKVLRGDLESLPIFPDYFASHESFSQASYLAWLGIDNKFSAILRGVR